MKQKQTIELNEEQKQAVYHGDGPCMTIAGPGSGKTFVLTHRIRALIEYHHVSPEKILVITFTKAAAIEMQSRFYRMTGSDYPSVTFGTFHSVFYRMLSASEEKEGADAKPFLKPYTQRLLLERILREQKKEYAPERTDRLLKEIARLKNEAKEAKDCAPETPYAESFPAIYETYEKRRRELYRPSFDDIAPDCLALFRSRVDVLEEWRQRFTYFLVDEFQDVCPVQEELLYLLAAPANNIFVVGDDDQAIYGFRGGTPDVLFHFRKTYPDARICKLSVNYRSVPAIVDTSLCLISQNRNRFPKDIRPARTETQAVSGVTEQIHDSEDAERASLLSLLKDRRQAQNGQLRNTAILTRTIRQATVIASTLQTEDILFYLKEKPMSLYDVPEARDILAYLRLVTENGTRADFLRIMNKPLRYLSRTQIPQGMIDFETLLRIGYTHPQTKDQIMALHHVLRMASHLRPPMAIACILRVAGYDTHLKHTLEASAYQRALSTVTALQKEAERFRDIGAFLRESEEEKARMTKTAESASSEKARTRGVRLMTMHASKGLEFDTVILPSLTDAPGGVRTGNTADTEEERRILYVAMTRAKNNLYLYKKRHLW